MAPQQSVDVQRLAHAIEAVDEFSAGLPAPRSAEWKARLVAQIYLATDHMPGPTVEDVRAILRTVSRMI